jgi:hypothetical protein
MEENTLNQVGSEEERVAYGCWRKGETNPEQTKTMKEN